MRTEKSPDSFRDQVSEYTASRPLPFQRDIGSRKTQDRFHRGRNCMEMLPTHRFPSPRALLLLATVGLIASLAAAPADQPALDYTLASGHSWFSTLLQPKAQSSPRYLFWQGGLGIFTLANQFEEAFRARIGYRYHGFDFQWGLERNTIQALVAYAPAQSVYQGAAFQLGWENPSETISFRLRSTLARMSSNDFARRNILLNQIEHRFVLYHSSLLTLALVGEFDLIVDLDDNGNKIAVSASLPTTFSISQTPEIELSITPLLAHIPLTSRQAAGGILDDLIYRPNHLNQATTLVQAVVEPRIYPLGHTALPLLTQVFFSLRGELTVYHLAPNPLESSQFDYRAGAAMGWGRTKGAFGIGIDYNPHDQWSLNLLVSDKW